MRKVAIILLLSLCALSGCSSNDSTSSQSVNASVITDNVAATSSENTADTTSTTTTTNTTKPLIHNQKPEGAVLAVKSDIEVYDRLTVGGLFSSTNVTLTNTDDVIITDEIGTFEVIITYLFQGKEYKHTVEYIVNDTTEPVITNGGWETIIEKGDSFDLNSCVGFADNYDAAPVLTYKGNVDTDTIGIYPVFATVTDSSGNKTSWELKVEVVDELPNYDDTSDRLSFDKLMEDYSGEGRCFGIDVSKWQGDIDFKKVKEAGCSFVIMRIGSYYDEYTLDSSFEQNYKGATEAGLNVGVYFYTTANTEEEIINNVKWINKTLDGDKVNLPIVFDWESFSNFQKYEMSIHDLNRFYLLFASELEKYGYDAMLYSSKNYLNNFWYDFSDEHPIWLAHYTSETDYEGNYDMWQMSCTGRIDGIGGDVDFNILYNQDILN